MVRYDSKSCISHCYIPFSCYSRSKCLLFTFVCSSMTNPLSQACSYWEIISNEVMLKHSIYKEVPIVQAETLKNISFSKFTNLTQHLDKKNNLPFPYLLFLINTVYKGTSVRFSACVLRVSLTFLKEFHLKHLCPKHSILSLLLHLFVNKTKSLKHIK